ncbi:hypothetical protein HMPREF8571_1636, partial [Streptococcus mitis ATCC 6249]
HLQQQEIKLKATRKKKLQVKIRKLYQTQVLRYLVFFQSSVLPSQA